MPVIPPHDVHYLLRRCVLALYLASFAAAGAPGHEGGQRRFPGFSDEHTAVLWLFDEPVTPGPVPQEGITRWYYTQTLTDASRNYFDLHRLNGAEISAGRFGNALRTRLDQLGSGMKLAANFASVPRVYGVFLPADHEFIPHSEEEAASQVNFFWYTNRPDHLLAALAGNQWTIELWLRLASRPGEVVTVFDVGQGDSVALQVDLLDDGSAARIHNADAGMIVRCPFAERLQILRWYHLAWTKPGDRDEICQYVDGKLVSTISYTIGSSEETVDWQPGLSARAFAEAEMSQPLDVSAIYDPQDLTQSVPEAARSVRLRGWIRAQYSGTIRFSTDPDRGLHLDVNHRPLIYGWFGRAKTYSRSPRWGELQTVAGKLYPVLIEADLQEKGANRKRLPLYWSWNGHASETIPAAAWLHSPEDVVATESDEGGVRPETLMKLRFNSVLASDRTGNNPLDGWLDEIRISDVCRYAREFKPVTHSFVQRSKERFQTSRSRPPSGTSTPESAADREQVRQKGSTATDSKTSAADVAPMTGFPLIFTADTQAEVIPFGARKHLFIDDALIETQHGLRFAVNSPLNPIAVRPRLPAGDHSFFQLDGKVALFAPAGYEGREDYAHRWLSEDGVHFRQHAEATLNDGRPVLIDTGVNAWGRLAIDPNPATPDWARFKFTAGVPHRGIYLLVSPDAIHWRRHETIMLQVGTGGESHWYWDDQAGVYRYQLKWDHGPGGRQAVEAESPTLLEPLNLPAKREGRLGLMTPQGFMPTRFAPDDMRGQVYRTRATKYRGAPDTYVAFLWRFDRETHARQVELAVSRDGKRWKFYGDDWYIPAEFDFHGHRIREVTSVDGLIEHGDEIWQYADYSTGRHDGSAPFWRVRLQQRLDGFVALTDEGEGGGLISKPLRFAGDALQLNASVAEGGKIKVALLDAASQPIPGFTLQDCDPITGDSVRHTITWRGSQNIGPLAKSPVRIQMQIDDGRLFSLEIKDRP